MTFAQGCSIECKGCQNRHLWSKDGGFITNEKELAKYLIDLSPHGNITLSGGEILDQPEATLSLLKHLRALDPKLNIILYSGRTWDEIFVRLGSLLACEVLTLVDILVDGPFIVEQDDSLITWRGSRNQRAIDAKASLIAGNVITMDWGNPEIIIDPSGDLHMPIGLSPDFSGAGKERKSRRCGQTKA